MVHMNLSSYFQCLVVIYYIVMSSHAAYTLFLYIVHEFAYANIVPSWQWLLMHAFPCVLNTVRMGRNSLHFADNIFRYNFSNENVCILGQSSVKFVHKGLTDSKPVLGKIMVWHWTGEWMLVYLLMYICITWPQWVNTWMNKHIFGSVVVI